MHPLLIEGDCLKRLAELPDSSIDLILCDLPYGTTQNKWDSVIPLDRLWDEYNRVTKDTGTVVLMSQNVFTAKVILSNEKNFKYKITWVKSKATNFLNAKRQPLRKHEDICVFYNKNPTYHPQMSNGEAYNKGVRKNQQTGSYGEFNPSLVKSDGERYPTDVIYFKTAESEGEVWHSTQKPVSLGEYLIKTYSSPGDVVLDNAFGSGSFLVAAARSGRVPVGIELNQNVERFKNSGLDMMDVANTRLLEVGCDARIIRSDKKIFD